MTSQKENSTNDRLSDSTPGPSTSRPQSEEAPHTPSLLGWPYPTESNLSEEHYPNLPAEAAVAANHGFWKNSFKSGLLAPYLGSPLGPLPPNPRGLASTFPGLYGATGAPPSWGRRSNSPPPIGLPTHLRSNECSRCGRLYKTRKGLKHHIKNECGVEPRFQCSHCDWKFKQKAHLLRHMARKHTIS
ncbi:hypothetical protein Anas_09421 [Armadillidium nasatum]|uniref:C2H2-type domain-containing protein n=1 Tax=Armadillidium nasatum TaxID=96803 RepID=A0A5N5TCC9_9CRUS|nr:hypothetical protein Anas_09421 [Armadillidium nasatum]